VRVDSASSPHLSSAASACAARAVADRRGSDECLAQRRKCSAPGFTSAAKCLFTCRERRKLRRPEAKTQMDSINHHTTARATRLARHAGATFLFGIVTVSGALGCASAPGGIGPREPDVASIARCGACHAASPLATTQEDRFALARPRGASLARERELANAASFATIGLLASLQPSDARASVDTWGTFLDGADVSQAGRLFSVRASRMRLASGASGSAISRRIDETGHLKSIRPSATVAVRSRWVPSHSARRCGVMRRGGRRERHERELLDRVRSPVALDWTQYTIDR